MAMTGGFVLERDFQKRQAAEETKEEIGGSPVSGVGALLRDKREKLGFDLNQIGDMTRLRPYIIEALENEEWDRLPPPVFVRGFIKAYAQTVGLDEIQAMALYKDSGSAQSGEPKPLVESSRRRIQRVLLILLVLAVLGVAVFRYLTVHSVNLKVLPGQEEKQIDVEKTGAQLSAEKAVEKKPEEKVVPEQPPAESKTLTSSVHELEEKILPVRDPTTVIAEEETSAVLPVDEPVSTDGGHVLRAIVTERTWVRVYIDDEDPREYIFQSGSNPQWKAEKGINLIVGNAAGIAIDFNGKRVENFGNVGQVIRLFFPEDFRSEKYED